MVEEGPKGGGGGRESPQRARTREIRRKRDQKQEMFWQPKGGEGGVGGGGAAGKGMKRKKMKEKLFFVRFTEKKEPLG